MAKVTTEHLDHDRVIMAVDGQYIAQWYTSDNFSPPSLEATESIIRYLVDRLEAAERKIEALEAKL